MDDNTMNNPQPGSGMGADDQSSAPMPMPGSSEPTGGEGSTPAEGADAPKEMPIPEVPMGGTTEEGEEKPAGLPDDPMDKIDPPQDTSQQG